MHYVILQLEKKTLRWFSSTSLCNMVNHTIVNSNLSLGDLEMLFRNLMCENFYMNTRVLQIEQKNQQRADLLIKSLGLLTRDLKSYEFNSVGRNLFS